MKRAEKTKSERRHYKKKRRIFPVSGKGVFLLARLRAKS